MCYHATQTAEIFHILRLIFGDYAGRQTHGIKGYVLRIIFAFQLSEYFPFNQN